MRFTALQDPCGQWMVFDLQSDFPAQMPDISLLGLTREEAEWLAGQANEFSAMPNPATLSRYFTHLSILYRSAPERSGFIGDIAALKQGTPMRFAAMRDPRDDWLVCDLVSDLPAEIEGRLLIGLTRGEAEQLAARANAGIVGRAINSSVPFASVA